MTSLNRIACVAGVLLAGLIHHAEARWKPEYANCRKRCGTGTKRPSSRRKRSCAFPSKAVCEHADVVKTQFRVNRRTSGDEWYWLDGETWRRVPDDIIHWGETAPSKQPTLFVHAARKPASGRARAGSSAHQEKPPWRLREPWRFFICVIRIDTAGKTQIAGACSAPRRPVGARVNKS
jgi:hypothetical protein